MEQICEQASGSKKFYRESVMVFYHRLNVKFPRNTAQKMKFCIQDFFSKCDQIRRKLPI